ncbi:hypothetical protein HY624_00920 [Candidatus Uhrbacteria bacterium]|nr:hypothetical protein [Candidatus Uhrbacteria bacterium]
MKRFILFSTLVGVFFIALFFYWSSVVSNARARGRSLPLIVHAGGGVRGNIYTSSREALDANYAAGYRLFELDFSWTSDRQLVLIHDWEGTYEKYFGMQGERPTRDQFLALSMKDNLTQLSLEQLFEWLAAHPDARVVTDVKEDTIAALTYIQERDPKFAQHFIPQIYDPEEYTAVRALGYVDIIFTLYRLTIDRYVTALRIFFFAGTHDLYAVTMPVERALHGSFASLMQWTGKIVYVHTVNEKEEYQILQQRGIGIYTDWIIPSASSTDALPQASSASIDTTHSGRTW